MLIDQFAFGHSHGSSHGTSRIFRLSYPDPEYTRMACEALEAWHELEAEVGEQLIVQSGTLDFGDAAHDVEHSLGSHDVPYELLDAEDVAGRWPISIDKGTRAVFQPEGGYVRADRALAALLTSARAARAELVEETRVESLDVGDDAVVVGTAERELRARIVIVAAGAWAAQLLEPVGIALQVVPTRETLSYFAVDDPDAFPSVIEYPSGQSELSERQVHYSLPAPGRGLKAGVHQAGPVAHPDEPAEPAPAVVDATIEWIARRFPHVEPTPTLSETCMYTNTADEAFVLERHGRVVVASACSGHGFKFAPVTGAEVARLTLEVLN
jgi:sarcosine oxidase